MALIKGNTIMYPQSLKTPTGEDVKLIDTSPKLAGIAIEHRSAMEELPKSEERFQTLDTFSKAPVFYVGTDQAFL